MDNISYILTRTGTRKAGAFIGECMALRKELLDAHKDTADETTLPTIEDILSDLNDSFIRREGTYCNGWGVTDNRSLPIELAYGEDFMEARTYEVSARVTKTVTLSAEEAGRLCEYSQGKSGLDDVRDIMEKFMKATSSHNAGDDGYIPDIWLRSDLGLHDSRVDIDDVDLIA